MARGDSYVSERALFRDPRSGLRIVRLTHGPAISTNLYFEMCSFTQDERHVLFMSQRYGGRGAPYDLFRAQTDGMELVQLTDCDDISGVCFCPETNRVLYQTGREIRSLDALTLEEHTAGRVSGPRLDPQYSLASVDKHGASYYGMYAKPEGGSALFRLDVATGAVVVLHEATRHNHINVNPLDRQVYFNVFEDGVFSPRIMSTDGTCLRPFPFQRFAHHTWLGETGAWQGCLLNPDSGVVTFEEGAVGPTVLAGGRYYWHSSASVDGKWIAADTNWPQEGIYLLHVPSRTVNYVCNPRASCSHPQWTHPHPSFSPGMRYVLFNSDVTGIGQVYLAELTPEFLAQAASGAELRLAGFT